MDACLWMKYLCNSNSWVLKILRWLSPKVWLIPSLTKVKRIWKKVKDNKERTILPIDMSVPIERNVTLKITENISTYKELEIEIVKMFGTKRTTIPVVMGPFDPLKEDGKNTPKYPWQHQHPRNSEDYPCRFGIHIMGKYIRQIKPSHHHCSPQSMEKTRLYECTKNDDGDENNNYNYVILFSNFNETVVLVGRLVGWLFLLQRINPFRVI